MAFFEELFPPQIAAYAQGGPRFLTEKAYTSAGQRSVNLLAQYPLHEFTIDHPVRSGQDFKILRAFFYVVGGDADGFLFKDLTDYQATNADTSLTLISGSVYQLNRTYTFGSRTFTRPIYKPRSGAVITRNRSGTLSVATATIDTTTGRATISGHVSGDTYTWTGEFYIPVAFKNPKALWTFIGTPSLLTEWTAIELEEFRL